ncbi:MAG: efflux RND transporter periplasmic adaptor subunit [Myxococcales bacterium]
MKWFKRVVTWSIATAIAAGLVWAAWPKPVAVDLATVARGPFEVTVSETGRTRVRNRYAVSAPVSGALSRIGLRPGDAVDGGQLVARIVPADPPLLDARTRAEALSRLRAAEASRGRAAAQLDRASTQLAFARTEAERQRKLAAAGSVPERVLDAAQAEERARGGEALAANFAVQAADAEVEAARATVAAVSGRGKAQAEAIVRAPARGVVLRVLQQSEAPVAAGTPLLEIGEPDELEVVVDLLTQDAMRVLPGAPARIAGLGGEDLPAHVRRYEPSGITRLSALGVEEQRVCVLLDASETVPRLGDGYRVEVAITVFSGADVLQVPASAVFRSGSSWSLFVAEGSRVRLRVVELGQRNEAAVQVLAGVRAGERVLLHPSDRVREGSRYVERVPTAPRS